MDLGTIDRSTLEGKVLSELQEIAQGLGIEGAQRLRKAGLIDAILARTSGDGRERPAADPAGEADGGGAGGIATATVPQTPQATAGEAEAPEAGTVAAEGAVVEAPAREEAPGG
ncbi:MAG TPA: Rho termination factor N-terminal domain-containing protein, partial [Actinomycetota bacterium]|nr:Rho termination factor N-terminal domain-containing protein [Actinomycetota bacterium]